jgi:hypothetical protein
MIVKVKGSFKRITKFLLKYSKEDTFLKLLKEYGERGVQALASATPVDTGTTRDSWYYKITQNEKATYLSWHNRNSTSTGTPIVILLRYGHATNNGGYVEGYDFIDPSIKPIFDGFTQVMWEEVKTS